jgi:hypothetical protein
VPNANCRHGTLAAILKLKTISTIRTFIGLAEYHTTFGWQTTTMRAMTAQVQAARGWRPQTNKATVWRMDWRSRNRRLILAFALVWEDGSAIKGGTAPGAVRLVFGRQGHHPAPSSKRRDCVLDSSSIEAWAACWLVMAIVVGSWHDALNCTVGGGNVVWARAGFEAADLAVMSEQDISVIAFAAAGAEAAHKQNFIVKRLPRFEPQSMLIQDWRYGSQDHQAAGRRGFCRTSCGEAAEPQLENIELLSRYGSDGGGRAVSAARAGRPQGQAEELLLK